MSISSLRSQIDSLDAELLQILVQRMDICKQIGQLKKESALSICDFQREQTILQQLYTLGKEQGISEQCISSIWQAIFQESKQHQTTDK